MPQGNQARTIKRWGPKLFFLTLPALAPIPAFFPAPSSPPQAVAMVSGIPLWVMPCCRVLHWLPCPDGLLKNAEMPRKGYITSLRPWNEYDCQIPSVWNKIFCGRRILEIRRKSTPKKRTGGSSEDGQMERVSLVSSSPPLNLLWNLSQVIWTLILRSQILICKMWGEERVWGT